MRTIYKYKAPSPGETLTLDLPMYAYVVHVGCQNSEGMMWVEIDTASPNESPGRTFHTIGTGSRIPVGASYVGTWFSDGYVWHLYEQVT